MTRTRIQQSDGPRLEGTLVRLHEAGYGFIEGAAGEPAHFVLRSQIRPEDWVKGRRFSFVSAPPRREGQAPRAEKLLPLNADVVPRNPARRLQPA